jgi:hypothetical protein
MPIPVHPFLRAFGIAGLLALTACLFDDPPRKPTIAGHFGNRLEGLPPRALLDSSYLALGLMRGLSGDDYTYENGYSNFVGGHGGGSWRVTVRAGVPLREEFVSIDADGKETRMVRTPADWSAPADAGGEPSPAPPTLDSIYAQCRVLLEACASPGTPVFDYDQDYVLAVCGCQDPRYADGYPSVGLQKLSWIFD